MGIDHLAMNLSDSQFALNPSFDRLGSVNSILSAPIRTRYRSTCQTSFTIKFVLSGAASYRTRFSRYEVEPGRCLILNDGQTYDLDIAPDTGTETLAFFFERDFLASATASLTHSEEGLEALPNAGGDPGRMFEGLYVVSGEVGRLVDRIGRTIHRGQGDEAWVEDSFFALAKMLPVLSDQTARAVRSIGAARPSTQREILRRLLFARDLAWSEYRHEHTTTTLARAAMMSPFHFHRHFREAFGTTPARFIQERRLCVARTLLLTGEYTARSACDAVGFRSPGSFGSLFRRRFGDTPAAVGKMARGEVRKN